MLQRWRAVGNSVSDMTGPRFVSQTSRSSDECVTARPTGLLFFNFQVGRSPCGSGTTARMALLIAKKLIEIGEVVEFENPFTKSV